MIFVSRKKTTLVFFPAAAAATPRCKCWDNCLKTDLGQRWYRFRQSTLQYVDTPAFEWFVLVLIFASSITLCFEDIHLDKNKRLKQILYWTNFVFCLIFVIEMLLKWVALGFTKYFSSFWTILDFIIVFVRILVVFKFLCFFLSLFFYDPCFFVSLSNDFCFQFECSLYHHFRILSIKHKFFSLLKLSNIE